MLRRLLVLEALLLLPLPAFAQPPQPVDGALYLGTTERGRTLLISLHLFPPDGAELQLLEAPAEPGEEPSIELTLTAPYLEHERELEVTSESWTFIAGLLEGGALDSRGEAELYLYELEPIELDAVGTVILGGLRFADGTFNVQRWTPFFYAEPWARVNFDLSVDEVLREGVQQRREVPEIPMGTFTESRSVTVTAFDQDLLSFYTLIDTFTGGAHPNSWREASTLIGDADGNWVEVAKPCEAVRPVGWECDESTMRPRIIEELLRQEAAWVEQGDVTRDTEWLLDSFVLTPAGIRFLFDPYQVGPYVQGPFEVDVPYGDLSD